MNNFTYRVDTDLANHVDDAESGIPRFPDFPEAREPTPSLDEMSRRYVGAHPKFLLPHQETFASIFQVGLKTYYSRFDESLKNNWPTDYLAMRREGFFHQLLRHRQLPMCSLNYHVETDDPKDPHQKKVAEHLTKLVDRIPRFQDMRLYTDEDMWYGKYGSQIVWGHVRVDGKKSISIVDHIPVNGDKIVWKFDGTPGVMIHRGFNDPYMDRFVGPTDRGLALFLYDPFFRSRFIISQFEPNDTDFLFESDLAGGVHGTGLRSRLYWTWFLRNEVLAWCLDALQRIGVNGMIVGYHAEGDEKAEEAMIKSLLNLIKNNVASFPRRVGGNNQNVWDHVEPSKVGYEILFQLLEYFDDIMRRTIIGQDLSTNAKATGIGTGAQELQGYTLENIIKSDAKRQGEVLTDQLLKPMIKFNYGELPFHCRLVIQAESTQSKEKMESAKSLHEMNMPLDAEEVYAAAGFTAPKDDANVIPGKMDLASRAQQMQAPPPQSAGGLPQTPEGLPNGQPPQANGQPSTVGLPPRGGIASPATVGGDGAALVPSVVPIVEPGPKSSHPVHKLAYGSTKLSKVAEGFAKLAASRRGKRNGLMKAAQGYKRISGNRIK